MNKDLTMGNPQNVLWKFCLSLSYIKTVLKDWK